MRLTLYPFDINRSTVEFDENTKFESNIYDRFKRLALFLKSQNKGTIAVAAASIQQFADIHGCTVKFIKNMTTNHYEKVVIEPKKEEP